MTLLSFMLLPLVAVGFVAAPWSPRCSALRAQTVFVDLDVVADTLEFEGEMTLRGLQALIPQGPWQQLEVLPNHRWRTFDLHHKFDRILSELRVCRPAEAVMILRMLFEEDEVGARALRAREEPSGQRWASGGWAPTDGPLVGVRPGTRPLTAGEVVENWEAVLSARCAASWQREGISLATIDDTVLELYAQNLDADVLRWRPDSIHLLRTARDRGKLDRIVVVVRGDGPVGHAVEKTGLDIRRVLDAEVTVVASPRDLADTLLATHSPDARYLGGSPGLTLQLAAALSTIPPSLRVYHCAWVTRWDGRRSPIPVQNDLGIRVLDREAHNLRYILGLQRR
ncbi:hypothetical protein CTAYLR_005339 [Chrysophaeum taylorii]|uniref:Uncharacterized protein n=1 Tax=Chrysophaeum taylorii TaxID=2483200 RepID=A0AAD7U7M0_9STRA|nr:hypothetical protein CTAYLR_005339 [Chrysophaeum taylorii]